MRQLLVIAVGIMMIIWGIYSVCAGASFKGASYEAYTPQAFIYGSIFTFVGAIAIYYSKYAEE
ncbi:MAG: hypothetical protein ACYTFY_11945 [Planctomycetota bacterium]|jgi:uncharacterized membrane protein HdeD (DUF308 family)